MNTFADGHGALAPIIPEMSLAQNRHRVRMLTHGGSETKRCQPSGGGQGYLEVDILYVLAQGDVEAFGGPVVQLSVVDLWPKHQAVAAGENSVEGEGSVWGIGSFQAAFYGDETWDAVAVFIDYLSGNLAVGIRP